MASSSSISTFSYTATQIPIFDGDHYEYWSSQMDTIFISQDLWTLVDEGFAEPPQEGSSTSWSEEDAKDYKQNVQRNATALRIIQQGVSKSIYLRIFSIKKAREG
jgi:hypothetical protein